MSASPTATDTVVTYRQATPADREATLAISAHFPNDWLAWGFDTMTKEGRFFVAEKGGRVIAVCGYQAIDQVAWFQAMRVAPEAHNRGVATDFTRFLMDECRRRGFHTARLDTEITNAPVHHLMGEKLGFRRRGELVVAGQELGGRVLARPTDTIGVRAATPEDLGPVWRFLTERVAAGLLHPADLAPPVEEPWQVGDFGRDQLARRLEQGAGLLAEVDGVPAGLAVWYRTMMDDDGAEADADGAKPGRTRVYGCVTYLEGETPVQASLLQAALERIGDPLPFEYFNLGLVESQWRSIRPLLDQAWLAGPEAIFQAVIYDKDLG